MSSRINTRLILTAAVFSLLLLFSTLSTAAEATKKAPVDLKSLKITLPESDRKFADGPGSAIANGYCMICHSAGMVTAQPPLPKATWQKIVTKMRQDFGCPLPEENVTELVDYLYRINRAKITGAQTKSPAS